RRHEAEARTDEDAAVLNGLEALDHPGSPREGDLPRHRLGAGHGAPDPLPEELMVSRLQVAGGRGVGEHRVSTDGDERVFAPPASPHEMLAKGTGRLRSVFEEALADL